jgi:FixJ family two-component response regulator
MSARAPLVYVVDDDPSVRRGVGRLLRLAGYQVRTFGSADEFLEGGEFDAAGCLILDVRLPGASGLELQETLAARGSSLPVVFITGHGDEAMHLRALKAGAVDFLQKPFSERTLLAAVGEALARPRGVRSEPAS